LRANAELKIINPVPVYAIKAERGATPITGFGMVNESYKDKLYCQTLNSGMIPVAKFSKKNPTQPINKAKGITRPITFLGNIKKILEPIASKSIDWI